MFRVPVHPAVAEVEKRIRPVTLHQHVTRPEGRVGSWQRGRQRGAGLLAEVFPRGALLFHQRLPGLLRGDSENLQLGLPLLLPRKITPPGRLHRLPGR